MGRCRREAVPPTTMEGYKAMSRRLAVAMVWKTVLGCVFLGLGIHFILYNLDDVIEDDDDLPTMFWVGFGFAVGGSILLIFMVVNLVQYIRNSTAMSTQHRADQQQAYAWQQQAYTGQQQVYTGQQQAYTGQQQPYPQPQQAYGPSDVAMGTPAQGNYQVSVPPAYNAKPTNAAQSAAGPSAPLQGVYKL
ncbi:hypothetical protein HOP50_08g52640 [Chloropicon primus]|nr:hypothetical protein HOP50_08g52640 [Chloropicon primus]